jgi:hypothetical protein
MAKLIFRFVEDSEILETHKKNIRGITLYSYSVRVGEHHIAYVPQNHVHHHKNGLLLSEKILMQHDLPLPGLPMDSSGNVLPQAAIYEELKHQISLLKVKYGAPFNATPDNLKFRRTGKGWAQDGEYDVSVSQNSVLARLDGAYPASEVEKMLRLPQGIVSNFFYTNELHHTSRLGKLTEHYCSKKVNDKLSQIKSLIVEYKALLAKVKKDLRTLKNSSY